MYGNDAAVMCIKEDRYEYMVTKAVEHPYYLPDLTNAIHYTFPFIMENLSELMYGAVMFFVAPREDDSEPEPVTKESNTKTLMRLDRYNQFVLRIFSKRVSEPYFLPLVCTPCDTAV